MNTCGQDPPCPPRDPVPPGFCGQTCVYKYKEINGVKCKVSCKLGPPPPRGPSGTPCPITVSIVKNWTSSI